MTQDELLDEFWQLDGRVDQTNNLIEDLQKRLSEAEQRIKDADAYCESLDRRLAGFQNEFNRLKRSLPHGLLHIRED